VPEELWMEVCGIVQEAVIKTLQFINLVRLINLHLEITI